MRSISAVIKDINKKKQVYLMLLPNIILFSALSLYPIIWVFRYMFYQYNLMTPEKYIGIENFVRAFTRDAYFWKSVVTTFTYAGGKLLITLPLSFFIALILNKSFKASKFMQVVIFTPTMISASVMSIIFYMVFNAYNGELNRYLMILGLLDQPINWLGEKFAMLTVVLVGAWGGIGNYMVYFIAGLQSIPKDVYESADIDGASSFQKLYKITIPMLGPVLKVILMLAITIAFQDMQSIMVLTEGGPHGATEVMFLYVYRFFFPISTGTEFYAEFGYGAALSVISTAIVGVVTVIYLFIARKLDDIH